MEINEFNKLLQWSGKDESIFKKYPIFLYGYIHSSPLYSSPPMPLPDSISADSKTIKSQYFNLDQATYAFLELV